MNIIKLWAVFLEERKYFSSGQMSEMNGSISFGSDYYSNYKCLSLHSSKESALNKCNNKFMYSYKEVFAVDIGDDNFIILGLVKDAMKLS